MAQPDISIQDGNAIAEKVIRCAVSNHLEKPAIRIVNGRHPLESKMRVTKKPVLLLTDVVNYSDFLERDVDDRYTTTRYSGSGTEVSDGWEMATVPSVSSTVAPTG